MLSEDPEDALELAQMENEQDKEPDEEEQPLVSLRPLDMSVCKILLSLPEQTHKHRIQEMLQTPLVLDEECDLVIGSSENDFSEKIEEALLKLKSGETGTFKTVFATDQSEQSLLQEFVDSNCIDKSSSCRTVVIHVTLISCDPAPYVFQLSTSEKLSTASFYKDLGNKLFKANHTEKAFAKYSRALKYLTIILDPSGENIEETYVKMKCQCFINMAACQMKCRGFEFVVKNCTEALSLDPQNVKALYRRALAYRELGELQLAALDLEKALEVEPQNRTMGKILNNIKTLIAKSESNLSKAMSKMFT